MTTLDFTNFEFSKEQIGMGVYDMGIESGLNDLQELFRVNAPLNEGIVDFKELSVDMDMGLFNSFMSFEDSLFTWK